MARRTRPSGSIFGGPRPPAPGRLIEMRPPPSLFSLPPSPPEISPGPGGPHRENLPPGPGRPRCLGAGSALSSGVLGAGAPARRTRPARPHLPLVNFVPVCCDALPRRPPLTPRPAVGPGRFRDFGRGFGPPPGCGAWSFCGGSRSARFARSPTSSPASFGARRPRRLRAKCEPDLCRRLYRWGVKNSAPSGGALLQRAASGRPRKT